MTANKIQTHERLKRMPFIMAKQHARMFGVNPFIKLQNNRYTMIKRDVWHLSALVWAVFLRWFGVQCLKDCWHDNDISFFTCIFLRPKMMCRCHEPTHAPPSNPKDFCRACRELDFCRACIELDFCRACTELHFCRACTELDSREEIYKIHVIWLMFSHVLISLMR